MVRTTYGDHERCRQVYFSSFEGMYFTGDGARRDENGFYRIIGRVDDVINVSGHRLGTAEVEDAIKSVNGVHDAMVKARQNRITGSILTADVVLHSTNDKSDMESTIKERLSRKFQPWMIPRIFHFVPELQKTTTGKKVRR